MDVVKSERGFEQLVHPAYLDHTKLTRLVGQSSAIGDYSDSWDRPGSSYLWVGEHHHLNREEVSELIDRLQQWLSTGSLQLPETAV